MNTPSTDRRFLGITVLGDYLVSEGVEPILENLLRIGATAVATNPTVTAPAEEGTGSFQPPIDAGSSPRVFDRPLFGKPSLWVRSGVSYRPRTEFYADSPYGPRQPNDLTDEHGHIIGEFIDRAVENGLKVYFQIGAAQPSGLRDEDRPRLPTGEIPPNRMADTGSLASPAIRAYNRAYIRDLLEEYPTIAGFRPDWPEYPCYTLGECFQDFSPHVANWADEHDYEFEPLRRQVESVWRQLHGGLTNDALRWSLEGGAAGPVLDEKIWWPINIVGRFLEFKRQLAIDLLRSWRSAIDDAGGPEKELSANAFMFPWNKFTGFDSNEASQICDAISPKLYTMHWSQMIEFWGRELLESNPGLDESMLVRVLEGLLVLTDDDAPRTLSDYGYPNPDEPHPIADGPQRRKVDQEIFAAFDRCAVTPLVHGYGPVDDFTRRLQIVAESEATGVWINRYGYLSDAKLDRIAEIWNE